MVEDSNLKHFGRTMKNVAMWSREIGRKVSLTKVFRVPY